MIHSAKTQGSWSTLLPEEDAARALEVVADVAEDLSAGVDLPLGGDSSTIATGSAGLALFWAYLDKSRPNEGFAEKSAERIEQALELLAEEEATPGLYQGFSGVAWTVDHLRGDILDPDEDLNAEIDEALLHLLGRSPWERHYDLISGLTGLAVYALNRLPIPAATKCLERIVDRLAELAVERPSGITWFTRREFLGKEAFEFFPNGNYNLGVAHGVPGVIAVLGRVCRAGVATAKARPLLDGAVRWLLGKRLEGCKALFPTAVAPEVETRFSRAAWCYGDPGIAATLLSAARAVGVGDWEEQALDIACHSARRPVDTMLVRDCCLCHGAAGLAHLFNRMYQATGEELLREAALYWYRHVLSERRPGQGVGGFMSWGATADQEMEWQADPGFLNGAAGISLVLLAAATPVEPRWDELMLISPTDPPAGGEGP